MAPLVDALAPLATQSALSKATRATENGVQNTCQVCLDAIPGQVITDFCSAQCPAVLCVECLRGHLRVSIEAVIPGLLPKVRCPICLALVNKATWVQFAPVTLHEQYAAACRRACSFQTPCCHDTTYTHLPVAYDATNRPNKYIEAPTLKLVPSLQAKVDDLRRWTKRFCNHKMASRELIAYVEDTFGRRTTLEQQHLLLEHVLPRILDEERRATLLLSYHAKYKTVTTRCCGFSVCFNCKKHAASHANPEICDVGVIPDDCIVECRSCHVTMVKVEGCDSARCWCGFSLSWSAELRTRNRHRRGLIPVDIFDVKVYDLWSTWHQRHKEILEREFEPMYMALRLSCLDQLLPPFKTRLRIMLQSYIWHRRFRKALRKVEEELLTWRRDRIVRRLQKTTFGAMIKHRAPAVVQRARMARVLVALRTKGCFANYFLDHPEALTLVAAEERELLTIGL